MFSTLALIYFHKPRLGNAIKTNFIAFQTADPEICSILIFLKRVWEFSNPFCVWFFKRNISHVVFYEVPNFIVWLSLVLEILGNRCIVIICCPVCDVINFEIHHSFLIKPLFYITKKSGTKKLSQKRKELLMWNAKGFSSFLKGFY